MISDTVPVLGLSVLAILWLVRWIVIGQLSRSTPIDFPILGLSALLPLNLIISVDLDLTLAKIYGLILCVLLFYVAVNFINSISKLKIALFALIFLTIAVPVLGFLATDWSGSSFPLPIRILSRLGQYLPLINRFSSGGGIHVNTLGGTLSFFIPLLLSLLWDGKAINRTYLGHTPHRMLVNLAVKFLIVFSLLLSLALMVLTQSRGSYLGVIAGALVLFIWKFPKLYWLIPLIFVIIFASFLVFADGDITAFISLLDTSREGDTVQVRLDYWKRTVFLIQDFPFSGVGLGTYGKVFDKLYTFTPFSSDGHLTFYAHNMYLAVAASMGLPALVLYFALFSSTATMVISTYRKVRSVAKVLIMGLSCGILANLVYGLWDNYLLGEKLAVVLWIYLAVIIAIYIHQGNMRRPDSDYYEPSINFTKMNLVKDTNGNWFSSILFRLGSWVLFSLVAIVFININPYISLGISLLGGILLGVLLAKRFEAGNYHLQTQTIS